MKKAEIINKIKSAPAYVKEHWNTPCEGEYMPLKEMAAYTVAQAGTYIMMTVSGIMTFAATYFTGSIMGISNMDFSIIGVISTILGYILIFANPVSVLIYENHGKINKKTQIYAHCIYLGQLIVGILCYFIPSAPFEFIMKGMPQIIGNILVVNGITGYINWFIRYKFSAKHGRVKPFLVLCGIPTAVFMSVIPYLPVQNLSYTNKLIVLHFAFTFMSFFFNNYIGVNSMVTFMTPNSQERQKLYSIVPIITGLMPSIISIFFPMLIATTGGYLNIKTYKVFVPIFCFVGALASLPIAFCKERVIEPPAEKRKEVTFFKGAKNVIKNKYLWIFNISNILGQWQGYVGTLLAWWFIYSLRMEWFSGIAAQIVTLGYTFGGVLCPILTKKFQKMKIFISFRTVTLFTVFGVALAVKTGNIFIFMACMFIKNAVAPIVDGISQGLSADIQVYHQWRFGERSDAMSGIFGWFLNPINMGIGLIIPYILTFVGYTSDWDVLFDSTILNNVFNIYTWATIIGLVLGTVPYFFYDLTKEKYAMCVKELEERVKATSENAVEEVNG